MNAEKLKKKQYRVYYTPEDAYNEMFNVDDLVPSEKSQEGISAYEAKGKDVYFSGSAIFQYNPSNGTYTYRDHPKLPGGKYGMSDGDTVKPHQLLLVVKFRGDYSAARQFILLNYLDNKLPYFRIGYKYFKVVDKETRYGINVEEVILWQKEALVDDYGKKIIGQIQKFNGFICKPCNVKFMQSYKGYYNMYKRFPHQPSSEDVTVTDIPTISGLMAHIFGDQQELGYQYFKVLYEDPEQKLPVLCMVSKQRHTGKTTMLNFMQMLFGSNFGIINSEMLTSSFNSSYAHLNIIGVDETVIDKASAIEKIKMLATADTLQVNMKNVQEYPVEFFGKLVLATNKETDFMRIDNEEIRFWIRKPEPISKTDPMLNEKLVSEIPKFLQYLDKIPMPVYHTRMVFTPEQIINKELEAIKVESRSGLHKDLEILFTEWFDQNDAEELNLTATDIKLKWFENNTRITPHYLAKVLRDEMGCQSSAPVRYSPFNKWESKIGRPFTLQRSDFVTDGEGGVSVLKNNSINDDFVPF